MSCDRSLFLGDVFIDTATTCSIETASGSSSIALNKGTWFADPIAFWSYIAKEHRTQTGDDISPVVKINEVTIGSETFDTWGTSVCYIEFTGDTIVSDSIDNTSIASQVGWDEIFDVQKTQMFDMALIPRYATYQYDKTIKVLGTTVNVAENGIVTASTGIPVTTITLGITLTGETSVDGTTGVYYFEEKHAWWRLWNERWRKGRYVTFYLDYESVKDLIVTDTHYQNVQNADILGVSAENKKIQMSRLVANSDSVLQSSSFTFNLRPPIPLTEEVTQASRIL